MSRARRTRTAIAAMAAAVALLFQGGPCQIGPARAAAPLTIAVADFDYFDSSGEARDQAAEHRTRVALFTELLRANLGAQGEFRVIPIECAEPPCTPINMQPERFMTASRRSAARFVVYGGIHKTSTLVQWGDVELLDLEANKLLLRRTVTFRGDTDEAFRRAASFVGDTVRDAMEKR